MRIVFMGSPDFAVPSLNALIEAGHDVVAAYAQPPRPAGRGKCERKTAVHERADELEMLVRTPKTLRDPEEQACFRALGRRYCGCRRLRVDSSRRPILEAPLRGCVNVHASLLPRWRGAAPIQRSILAGDEVSGVTIMQMDEGLDTGPILLTRELDIRGKTAGQATEELAKLGASTLVEWLRDPTPPKPQLNGATYATKIAKAEARIDWSARAEQIERQVRAFNPVPGAWFEANGERLKLLEIATDDRSSDQPGEVIDDCLSIACGTGSVRPLKVQRAGRAPMTAGELVRGFAIPKGTILQ